MNKRQKGRMFEQREAQAWRDHGWIVDLAWPNASWIGKGKSVSAPRDFFGLYDLMAVKPIAPILVLIQVSNKTESTHSKPLGIPLPYVSSEVDIMDCKVDDLMLVDDDGFGWPSGIYEVYVYYRMLAHSRGYVPRRMWWNAKIHHSPRITIETPKEASDCK